MNTWKPLPDAPMYEVSDDGQVRSWHKNRWGRAATPRVLRQTLGRNGYRSLNIGGTTRRVHSMVALVFHGTPAVGNEVRHLDGIRTNNRADNLVWGTRSENNYDAVDHKTNHMSARTICPQGHPYDEQNTVHSRRGDGRTFRLCRACSRAKMRMVAA